LIFLGSAYLFAGGGKSTAATELWLASQLVEFFMWQGWYTFISISFLSHYLQT